MAVQSVSGGLGYIATAAPAVVQAAAGATQNSGSIATAALAAADKGALYGVGQAAVPDLLGDWQKAVIEASIEELADALIQPEFHATVQLAESQLGRPLERREQQELAESIYAQAMPQALAEVAPGVRAAPAKAYAEALARWRPQLSQLKDLQPMILDRMGGRAGEIVVWESPKALVVADLYAEGPKALVFPKPPVSLPVDLAPAELAYVAQVAAQVGAAFRDVDPAARPEIWVNPPQHLTVQQLHVHVQPRIGTWAARGGSARSVSDDRQLARLERTFYGSLAANLARRLGPSQ